MRRAQQCLAWSTPDDWTSRVALLSACRSILDDGTNAANCRRFWFEVGEPPRRARIGIGRDVGARARYDDVERICRRALFAKGVEHAHGVGDLFGRFEVDREVTVKACRTTQGHRIAGKPAIQIGMVG